MIDYHFVCHYYSVFRLFYIVSAFLDNIAFLLDIFTFKLP